MRDGERPLADGNLRLSGTNPLMLRPCVEGGGHDSDRWRCGAAESLSLLSLS